MITVAEIKRAARDAEKEANNGAPGLAILHFHLKPIDELVTSAVIGTIELQAAQEFSWVFDTIAWDLRISTISEEYARRQRGEDNAPATERARNAWQTYKSYCNYWSDQKKQYGDLTLAILVAAAIDQRPFATIAEDFNISPSKARTVVVRALRHYAARAGWCDKSTAIKWSREAHKSFAAVRRARRARAITPSICPVSE